MYGQMWELDHKEGWASKNGCFQIVVLEKTLESPLDCKIKPVIPRGNQPWIFIGRTDAEGEAPRLWLPELGQKMYIISFKHTCQVGRITSWNQDCWKKYQQPQICRWYHSHGRKQRGTKKPLDESESGEWKRWLKTQHSENKDHGIWSHHFMGNRWGNSGNSVRLYFLGLQKSLQMVTAAMKLKDAYSLEGKLWPT